MNAAPATPVRTVRSTLLVFVLGIAGFVVAGRLAMEAWLNRPVPERVPVVLPQILPPDVEADGEPRAYLHVIIDGLREAAAWDEGDDPPMPWLQAFAARGAWGIAIAGEPTLTAPCVRALLSGRRPDLLTGFRNFDARPVPGTIIEYLARRGARTAHGGDAAAFQFCRSWYPKDQVLQFPDRGPADQGGCDIESVAFVLDRIAAGRNAITLHVTFPDHAGHKHGATGRYYWEACRTVDDQLRAVVEAFLTAHPDALILIASDHGVSPAGTHGGGESSAKRAPFALVGPHVARGRFEIDQCALAPTICAVLGLPQPPLSDEPPHVDMMSLPPEVEAAAVEAHVEARLEVARTLGVDVDFIERRRAERTVRELGGADDQEALEVARALNRIIDPGGTTSGVLAILVGLFTLLGLVHLASVERIRPTTATWGLAASALALAVAFNPAPDVLHISSVAATVCFAAALALAVRATQQRPFLGGFAQLGWLLPIAVFTGAGLTVQSGFELADDPSGAIWRFGLGGVLGLGLLVFLPDWRGLLSRARAHVRAHPTTALAGLAALLGFGLTLRPFIDPFLHLLIIYAVLSLVLMLVWVRVAGRHMDGARRVLLVSLALVLFLGTRIGEGLAGKNWVEAVPQWDLGWLLLGAGALVALPWALRAERLVRHDWISLVPALLALAGAFLGRVIGEQALLESLGATGLEILTQSTNALAVLALLLSLRRGTPDGRFLARVVAGVALTRRLAGSDAESAVYAVAAVAAALCTHLQSPRRRVGLAGLALGLVLLRTGLFHAMGFTESFSTLDVGQAFKGLAGASTEALDPAEQAVIGRQIIQAGIQLAMRMGLPWVLFLAAVTRMFERSGDGSGGAMRVVLVDLVVAYGARTAAILVALPAWWRQSWWMTHAYTVQAYAAADVVLLLAYALLLGAFVRRALGVSQRAAKIFA